jgi:hypothetical protein
MRVADSVRHGKNDLDLDSSVWICEGGKVKVVGEDDNNVQMLFLGAFVGVIPCTRASIYVTLPKTL